MSVLSVLDCGWSPWETKFIIHQMPCKYQINMHLLFKESVQFLFQFVNILDNRYVDCSLVSCGMHYVSSKESFKRFMVAGSPYS